MDGTPALPDWERLWSLVDVVVLQMLPSGAQLDRPLALRHPFIFYCGHLPAFADARLARVLGEPLTPPGSFATLFARGMDPDLDEPSKCHAHSPAPPQWPPLEQVLAYRAAVRERIRRAYSRSCKGSAASAPAAPSRPAGPASAGLAAGAPAGLAPALQHCLWLAYEHEAMHLETLMYLLLQHPRAQPPPAELLRAQGGGAHAGGCACCRAALASAGPSSTAAAGDSGEPLPLPLPPPAQLVRLPGGPVRIGCDAGASSSASSSCSEQACQQLRFAWDNERPARTLQVRSCLMQHRPVTVLEYISFLAYEAAAQLAGAGRTAGVAPPGDPGPGQGASAGPAPASCGQGGRQPSACGRCSELQQLLAPGGACADLLPLSLALLPAGAPRVAGEGSGGGGGSLYCVHGGPAALPPGQHASACSTVAAGSSAAAAQALFATLQQLLVVKTAVGRVPVSSAGAGLWPVYCSALQAEHYARWCGGGQLRLPSEQELLRAEQCSAAAGSDPGASVDFCLWHPAPVPLQPQLASAPPAAAANGAATASTAGGGSAGVAEQMLVAQLRDNGWEWTSTVLDRHEGFEPEPLYPEYSQDFFDGKHVVLLGASWATLGGIAARRSFRNFYQRGQAHVFAKFRLVRDCLDSEAPAGAHCAEW